MNKHTFQEYLKDELKDGKFKKGYQKDRQKLSLGYQIYLSRERAGMTQQELAKKIGTRQSNISRLEQGGYNFTVELLEKIARALHSKLRIDLIPPLDKAA